MTRNGKSYYGGWIWLSIVSFAVPVVVAVYAFQSASKPFTKPAPEYDAGGVAQNQWDYLLKTYVADGLVDYDGLAHDYLFREYVRQCGQADFDAYTTGEERLAFFCNAYNAFVIDGVIQHGITDSVSTWKAKEEHEFYFFDAKEHILAGETVSLNHIEHERIRKQFEEPRIHMALVCAAISCPEIRREAYEAEHLDRQLEDQAVQFTNSEKHISYDDDAKTLELSALMNWYGQDWGGKPGYLDFLLARAESSGLKRAIEEAQAGNYAVVFKDYDWSLNTQGKDANAQGGGKPGGAGSGAITGE